MMSPVLSLIDAIARTRIELQADARKCVRLYALQRWQMDRLLRTYADFQARPQYRDAIEFFAEDLYGPHDYSQRDRDLQRVIEPWQRILPRRALQAVVDALELEALTLQLDLAMIDALDSDAIDGSTYALAYRCVDRRVDRERQIELTVDCGKALNALVANPWVRRALNLAKIPARMAGIATLHEFLERGYEAFAKMSDAREFLQAIEQRETAVMNKLFAGDSESFCETPSPHAALSSA